MKKATLLIINLEKVYTMKVKKQQDVILNNAYLAIHHDQILALGNDDYHVWMDKDTRVIDAKGCIALPGFIDVAADFSSSYRWQEQAYRYDLMRNGVLTIAMKDTKTYFEIDFVKQREMKYPILYGKEIMMMKKFKGRKQFCISGYDSTFDLSNPLLLAQILHIKFQVDALTLVKALTYYPAKALLLKTVGVLDVHKQADILLCKGDDICCLFDGIKQDKIVQVIKRGIRIYPFVLIS